eukprot:TRINITY_DN16177_c0_g1_i1.p1 TRINITY_DN16177_c0_g1~~TRINITY_DN16177_c0_g1_i1.p1  ORF type:complete len:624 (+),score=97.01 TRINITY_DN16177_c0_g1_i1:59-1930(+)
MDVLPGSLRRFDQPSPPRRDAPATAAKEREDSQQRFDVERQQQGMIQTLMHRVSQLEDMLVQQQQRPAPPSPTASFRGALSSAPSSVRRGNLLSPHSSRRPALGAFPTSPRAVPESLGCRVESLTKLINETIAPQTGVYGHSQPLCGQLQTPSAAAHDTMPAAASRSGSGEQAQARHHLRNLDGVSKQLAAHLSGERPGPQRTMLEVLARHTEMLQHEVKTAFRAGEISREEEEEARKPAIAEPTMQRSGSDGWDMLEKEVSQWCAKSLALRAQLAGMLSDGGGDPPPTAASDWILPPMPPRPDRQLGSVLGPALATGAEAVRRTAPSPPPDPPPTARREPLAPTPVASDTAEYSSVQHASMLNELSRCASPPNVPALSPPHRSITSRSPPPRSKEPQMSPAMLHPPPAAPSPRGPKQPGRVAPTSHPKRPRKGYAMYSPGPQRAQSIGHGGLVRSPVAHLTAPRVDRAGHTTPIRSPQHRHAANGISADPLLRPPPCWQGRGGPPHQSFRPLSGGGGASRELGAAAPFSSPTPTIPPGGDRDAILSQVQEQLARMSQMCGAQFPPAGPDGAPLPVAVGPATPPPRRLGTVVSPSQYASERGMRNLERVRRARTRRGASARGR